MMRRMEGQHKRRTYESAARRDMAVQTRVRILEAATMLFAEQGYQRTTTSAIGRAAGVSEASVFSAFGSKPQLLVEVVAHSAAGSDGDLPLPLHSAWKDLTPAAAVGELVGVVRRAHERSWRLLRLVSAAADGDPLVAEAAEGGALRRYADCLWFVGSVLGVERDAESLAEEVWALISVDLYRQLVIDRGWTSARYETWLAAMIRCAVDGYASDDAS